VPGLPSWLILGMSVPPLLWMVGKFIPRPRIRQYFGQAQQGDIAVTFDGNTLTVPCLWDSGNRMRDPVLRRPVIVMEVRQSLEWMPSEVLAWVTAFLSGRPAPVPPGWQGRLGSVLYHSIGGHGVLSGYCLG
jgi:stage II sporulation protein GA (sporulation sigma-E factor processing peptidase)